MQMVIKISEDAYSKLTQKSMLMSASAIEEAVDAVKNGIILPKGHSDLIDRSELRCEAADFDTFEDYSMVLREIYATPTIVPAEE